MEALQRVLPTGLPVSIQVVAATLVLGIIYSIVTADRPFTGFPVVSLDGKSPVKSWMWQGKETLEEGMRKV